MLRMVSGAPRRKMTVNREQDGIVANDELEPWQDWIKRVTRLIEDQLKNHNMENWVTVYRKRTWKWAYIVCNMDYERWARSALEWRPEFKLDIGRRQARPRKRWDDDISAFLKNRNLHEDWKTYAKDENLWFNLESEFTNDGKI